MTEDIEDLREQKRKELEEQKEEQQTRVRQQAKASLTSEARSRLENIRAADPRRAEAIEALIARQASRIPGKLDDDDFKKLLKELQNDNDYDVKFR